MADWLITAIFSLAGLLFLRKHLADLFMSIYEYLVQGK